MTQKLPSFLPSSSSPQLVQDSRFMVLTGADVFVLRLTALNAEGSESRLSPSLLFGSADIDCKQWITRQGTHEVFVDPAQNFKHAIALLSSDEIMRLRSLVHQEDRTTYLFAHAFLRWILSARVNCRPSAISFRLGAWGKPQLSAPAVDLHFNLSYRRNIIALALDTDAVGIDIEEIRPDIDLEGIAKRMFLLTERKHLLQIPERDRRGEFYRLWTRKEALLKAAGLGLENSFKANSLNDVQTMQDDSGFIRKFSLKSLSGPTGYALALGVRTPVEAYALPA